MAKTYLICKLVFLRLLSVTATEHLKEKRILLSDPNYLQQELHEIQVKLQDYDVTKNQVTSLQSKVMSQESELSTLRSKLAAVESIVSTFQQKPNSTTSLEEKLQSELLTKDSEIAALQSKVSTQQRELGVLQSKVTAQELNISSIRSKLSADESNIVYLQTIVTANMSEVSMQLAGQKSDISNLKLQVQSEQGDKGTVFVRWGRNDCPKGNGTDLVYSGYAGGSNFAHTGGAAEMVCLPSEPIWGPHKNIQPYNPAFMYGAEYEDALLFNMPNQDEDVPCAVCRSSSHSTSIMIPGRAQCYPDWVEAYRGVLSAGSVGSPSSTQYICVDENPQALPGGGITNSEGRLLFQVRTVCGSLQCPPYEDDKVLSCVVCLK